jgi:hypothetical protein
MQQWCCSNKKCIWTTNSNIKKQINGKVHIDLLKMQSEFGSTSSYRDSSDKLNKTTGQRSINNHMQIRNITNKVGKILSDHKIKVGVQTTKIDESLDIKSNSQEKASQLCAAVDGGHVHDSDNSGHNFEVMIGKIYKPTNVVQVDKHHTKIVAKHCAASAKYDKQKTMINDFAIAAKKEGIDKDKTEVIALADGAKNCWNILKSLIPLCLVLICILDWFHVGKYIERVKKSIPTKVDELDLIKKELWAGNINQSLSKIKFLKTTIDNEKHKKTIQNFYDYIETNKTHIVDYSARQKAGQIYTSHVAESTVEHLINERCKRKQKMQWSRDGIHSVIQIRSSTASLEWESDWLNIVTPILNVA